MAYLVAPRPASDPAPFSEPELRLTSMAQKMVPIEVEELFRLHAVRLGRFLAQVMSDRWIAEDLLQETFVAAVRKRSQLGDVENPEAWLFAIARNLALNEMRGRKRARRAMQRLAHQRPAQEPDPAEAVAVRDFLTGQLDAEDHLLLVLRYVHGFESNELGLIVGRSSEAIRQQLSRLTRRLGEQLGDERPQPPSAGDSPTTRGTGA